MRYKFIFPARCGQNLYERILTHCEKLGIGFYHDTILSEEDTMYLKLQIPQLRFKQADEV
jgi:hypothetical protein